MKNAALVIAVMLLSSTALAQSRTLGTFHFEDRNGNHTAKLTITTKAFEPSAHIVTTADQQYLKRNEISLAKGVSWITKVDGMKPLGTDGSMPRVEIASMTVSFGGTKITIPAKLYADCFNPNFQKDTSAVRLTDAGDSLLVFMAGSDAAGSYQIMWIFRKDGRHSRFVNNCSDCDYSGVLDFFLKQ